MLEKTKFEELLKIVQKASEYMEDNEFTAFVIPEDGDTYDFTNYQLLRVACDEDDTSHWTVEFLSKSNDIKVTFFVSVVAIGNGNYKLGNCGGHSSTCPKNHIISIRPKSATAPLC